MALLTDILRDLKVVVGQIDEQMEAYTRARQRLEGQTLPPPEMTFDGVAIPSASFGASIPTLNEFILQSSGKKLDELWHQAVDLTTAAAQHTAAATAKQAADKEDAQAAAIEAAQLNPVAVPQQPTVPQLVPQPNLQPTPLQPTPVVAKPTAYRQQDVRVT